MKQLLFFMLFSLMTISTIFPQENDPYKWLENVDDPKALDWVKTFNEKSFGVLSDKPEYEALYQKNLAIYNSNERIATPAIYGKYIYNFWQDAIHQRGIWRRTLISDYLTPDPKWEILLDLDDMMAKDSVKWVYKGVTGLYPDYTRFIVYLSKGGGDATVKREFDVTTKSFVENGFELEEGKGGVAWVDENSLMVYTHFGEGTLTNSGYPRMVKLWKRGTALCDASIISEGEMDDVSVWAYVLNYPERSYSFVNKAKTIFTSEIYAIEKNHLIKLNIPEDADFAAMLNGMVIIQLKSDWKVYDATYKQGALLSIPYSDLINGSENYTVLIEPTEKQSINSIQTTRNCMVVNMLNNVKSELYIYKYNKKWVSEKFKAPSYGTITLGASDDNSDQFFYEFENFLEPLTQYWANSTTGENEKLRSLPHYFYSMNFEVNQFEAVSKDGTHIPYFVVGAKFMKFDGTNPVLLNAYGGFEVSELPFYSGTLGGSWLEKGGVYVLANIRGGGEFGPNWHIQGIKESRQRVFDDFTAVAQDLISRKITSPKHLGIMGGSNGGLLVGVAFTQHPELYNAVVCQVPLLDMKRYSHLLAGASWMGEYGNPDIPEEWDYIKKYSPYQNVKSGMNYPEVFFMTSTRDDRVHPGHARKMVAKMSNMGYSVYYYENTEGGHAGSSTNDQRAKFWSLTYTYLQMKLMN